MIDQDAYIMKPGEPCKSYSGQICQACGFGIYQGEPTIQIKVGKITTRSVKGESVFYHEKCRDNVAIPQRQNGQD